MLEMLVINTNKQQMEIKMTKELVKYHGVDAGLAVEVDIQLKYNELGSKSALIRYYFADGKKKGEIAKMLGVRYQHVRNVLSTPLKKI